MIDYVSVFGYVPNITFTLEQHLKNYSEIEVNARRLLESFHIIRDKMEVNLRPVIALFPHYSEHSHEHSQHIISAIEKLLGRNRIEKLSPADTWMLLVCAYMHDLGMLVQGKELASDWKTPEFQNHIYNCMNSNDDEIKKAALNVASINWANNSPNWPVHIYRDVILLASEFYRRKHPERARLLPQRVELKQALNTVMSSDGKIPQRIQEVVGKICFSHGISFTKMLDLLEPLDSLLGYVFHPRFIASLLCLGDLCDLDNGRFNSMAIEVFGGLTKSNLVHYYKHESVTSFVIQKDMISVIFDIQNRKIKNELKNRGVLEASTNKELQDFCDLILLETQNWISWMVDIVKNIKLYWNEFYVFDMEALTPSLSYKILVEGKETISSKKNMRFSFSNEKAYELIEGYNLYNNKFTFVRELLQNSIDALKKQFWIDILSGRWNHLLKHLENDGRIDYKKIQPHDFLNKHVFDYYQIKIHVKHDDNDQFANFVIEDCGTGISKEDVEKRIIDTGIHNDLNDEFINSMPEWLKPTSAFGIGLHSVFSVTDTLFVQTRTEFDKTAYNINMHSGKLDGYVFMSVAEQQDIRFCNCNHGTKMEFSVNVSRYTQNEQTEEQHDDPLTERPESNFCRMLQNTLTSMMDVSLFHITYKFNCDKEITLNKMYQDRYIGLLFRSDRRNNVFGKPHSNDHYDFALDISGEHIILWDKQLAVAMVYSLKESRRPDNCRVFCKGFRVEKAKIFGRGYNMTPDIVDYWGGNTKNILNISRDSLSQEQMERNKDLFSQARTFMAEVYYLVLDLLLKDNDIKRWHNDISALMEPWMKIKTDDIVTPNLSEDVNVFLDKYKWLMYCKDDIKSLLLRHGFCLILKSCKDQIQGVLHSLDGDEKIKYVLGFGLLDEKNSINKVINEQTYLLEFIDAALEMFDNENDQMYVYESFVEIFKAEYADIFINYSEHKLYKINDNYHRFGMTFGEVYTSVFVGQLACSLRKARNRYIEYSKKEEEGYIPRPLDVYLSVPLTRIVYLLICTDTEVFPLKTALISELSYIPGYNNSYGFIGVNNVSDLIMSSQLKIENEKLNDTLVEYLPFMCWLSCKNVSVNSDGKLMLLFSNIYEKREVIEFQNGSFAKLLYSNSHLKMFPVPLGYEDIAINRTAALSVSSKGYHEELCFYGNYATCLWDDFISISERYGPRIAAGENKEALIDEILPNSRTDDKPTINLLRYICHNRVYNSDLQFEEAWRRVYETYRRFVSMVLDCISG